MELCQEESGMAGWARVEGGRAAVVPVCGCSCTLDCRGIGLYLAYNRGEPARMQGFRVPRPFAGFSGAKTRRPECDLNLVNVDVLYCPDCEGERTQVSKTVDGASKEDL